MNLGFLVDSFDKDSFVLGINAIEQTAVGFTSAVLELKTQFGNLAKPRAAVGSVSRWFASQYVPRQSMAREADSDLRETSPCPKDVGFFTFSERPAFFGLDCVFSIQTLADCIRQLLPLELHRRTDIITLPK